MASEDDSPREAGSNNAADSEADTLYLIRKLLMYLPQNNMEDPPFLLGDDPLRMDERLDNQRFIAPRHDSNHLVKRSLRLLVSIEITSLTSPDVVLCSVGQRSGPPLT